MTIRVGFLLFAFTLCSGVFAQAPGALTHQEGLSLVMLDRIRFNDFLGTLPPAFARERKLSPEQMTKIKESGIERRNSYLQVLASLKPKWNNAGKTERRELLDELLKKDHEFVVMQLDTLGELLIPAELNGLFKEFLRSGNPSMLFDPVIVEHLQLTSTEVGRMQMRLEESRNFLDQHRKQNGNFTGPLPSDPDKEFRSIRERIWSELPPDKLVKCFRLMGMIGDNDELKDMLVYYPDRAEYLLAEVPAIAESWNKHKQKQ